MVDGFVRSMIRRMTGHPQDNYFAFGLIFQNTERVAFRVRAEGEEGPLRHGCPVQENAGPLGEASKLLEKLPGLEFDLNPVKKKNQQRAAKWWTVRRLQQRLIRITLRPFGNVAIASGVQGRDCGQSPARNDQDVRHRFKDRVVGMLTTRRTICPDGVLVPGF
jgi:hypothetical protein